MINISLLYEEIAPILSELVNVPVIIQDQEGVAPTGSYVSYKIKDWTKLGHGEQYHYGGTSALFITETLHRCTLNLLCVGNDANQLALELSHRIQKSTVRYSLQDIGLTYLNQEDIKPAPKPLGTGWEQRYILDVNFNIIISDTDEIGYVEFIEVTTTIENPAGDVVINDTQVIDIVP